MQSRGIGEPGGLCVRPDHRRKQRNIAELYKLPEFDDSQQLVLATRVPTPTERTR